jgi:hypothetical protein
MTKQEIDTELDSLERMVMKETCLDWLAVLRLIALLKRTLRPTEAPDSKTEETSSPVETDAESREFRAY